MRLATILVFASALCVSVSVSARDLIVDGPGQSVNLVGVERYDHICVINGGTVHVTPYSGNKATGGNL